MAFDRAYDVPRLVPALRLIAESSEKAAHFLRQPSDWTFEQSAVGQFDYNKPLACLFDHLVGTGEYAGRNGDAERLRGLEIYNQFEFGRLLDWHIGRLIPNPDEADSRG
jgi:hypothetical protein